MPDRAFLFLFSVVMIAAGLGSAAWLVATGQATTVDGLFLLLTALLIAACFALYIVFMIRRAMEAFKKQATQPAKAGSTAQPAKPATAPVAQR
jgi:hypothetical protein